MTSFSVLVRTRMDGSLEYSTDGGLTWLAADESKLNRVTILPVSPPRKEEPLTTESLEERLVYPLPELLGRGEYNVRPGRSIGCTDLAGRIMTVPNDDTDQAMAIRVHAMAHVAITPLPEEQDFDLSGIAPDCLDAAEDRRINQFVADTVFEQRPEDMPGQLSDKEGAAYAQWLSTRGDLREMVCAVVSAMAGAKHLSPKDLGLLYNPIMLELSAATIETGIAPAEVKKRQKLYNDFSSIIGWAYGETVTKWPEVIKFARELTKQLEEATSPPSTKEGPEGPGLAGLLDLGDEALRKLLAQARTMPGAKDEDDDEKLVMDYLRKQLGSIMEKARWGKMKTFFDNVLPFEHPTRRMARKIRPKEMGEFIQFPDRLDHDDKIFGSIRRVKGGTVLIDVSGSMGISSEQVMQIIAAAPGATVAVYSGGPSTHLGITSSKEGHLTIIAKDGRMADVDNDRPQWPGNNLVDGPALEWLGEQKRPRLWVSDGQVTGIGDVMSEYLKIECQLTSVRKRIRRVRYPEDAVNLLKSGGFR